MILRILSALVGLLIVSQAYVERKKKRLKRTDAFLVSLFGFGAIFLAFFPKVIYIFEPSITEIGAYAAYFGIAFLALLLLVVYLLKKVNDLEKKLERLV